ncbi:MAG TPA: DUF6526 family protein [Sediminibacterium sp.]|nr:DUF6526 family protein [Sediminibacterium sp.]
MSEQNFRNHARYVPAYHFLTSVAILALLVGSFINLAHSAPENLYSASLICLIALILVALFWFARSFALKAQDRAIRAEENLRYFILTGKRLPLSIRMSQVIALRFASDEEFPVLVERTVTENLRARDIKQAIANWRADHHRA